MSRVWAYLPAALCTTLVAGAMGYAHLPLVFDAPECHEYFPPFERYHNRLRTQYLGAEYFNIAKAIRDGRGFADPFDVGSGPTAWMPPVLPALLAGLLWACGDEPETVRYAVVTVQALALCVTGWLLLAAAGRGFARPRRWLAAVLWLALLADQFFLAFQATHDHWLVMLALDALLLGFAAGPGGRWAVARWGLLGGLAVHVAPALGPVWAGLAVLRWPGRWRVWAAAAGVAVLASLPWAVRNYTVFGHLVPVKSNAAYELYQSQCRTPDGLVRNWKGFDTHPYNPGPDQDRYAAVGEPAFLAEKRAAFAAAVRADPGDFAVRAWNRLMSATVVVVPMDKKEEEAPLGWVNGFGMALHPLPLAAAAVLLVSRRPLSRYERAALWVWAGWLLPYVLVSYYDRYGFPLLGVKAFLCVAAADRLLGAAGRRLRTT